MVVFIGFGKCPEKSSYSTFADNLMKLQLAVGLPLSVRKGMQNFKNSEVSKAEFISKKATFL